MSITVEDIQHDRLLTRDHCVCAIPHYLTVAGSYEAELPRTHVCGMRRHIQRKTLWDPGV